MTRVSLAVVGLSEYVANGQIRLIVLASSTWNRYVSEGTSCRLQRLE